MKWSRESSRGLRLSTVFIKIQISQSVLMCCCLSNESDAYDDDNGCLETDKRRAVARSGHLRSVEMATVGNWSQLPSSIFGGRRFVDGIADEAPPHLLGPSCSPGVPQRSVNFFLRPTPTPHTSPGRPRRLPSEKYSKVEQRRRKWYAETEKADKNTTAPGKSLAL